MISIIVCSHNKELFNNFKNSLKSTIGCEYELIRIDNSEGELSIAQAYNKGAAQSNFPFLVFVHEDIVFHTQNWGKLLIAHFNSIESVGVLGIAGSSYLPISPSDWWVPNTKYIHTNFLSNHKNGKVGTGKHQIIGNQTPTKVYALDGMFLAVSKAVFKEFSFDESLPGFHGYDTSICYRVSQKFRNHFIPNILIEHFSKGYPTERWLKNTISANQSILSTIRNLKIEGTVDKKLEIKAFHLFLSQLKKYSSSYQFSVFHSYFYFKQISSVFLSGRVLFLWLSFQIIFLLKIFK